MEKIYTFENDGGVFVCFNDFPNEGDFGKFVAYLRDNLRVVPDEVRVNPYSITTRFEYSGAEIVAMYDENTGCCIRSEKNTRKVLGDILQVLNLSVSISGNSNSV